MNPYHNIQAYMNEFTDGESKIADFIIKNYDSIPSMYIKEISKATDSAESSINRFSKKIGYSGFRELKMAIAMTNNLQTEDAFVDIESEELSPSLILRTFLVNTIHNLENNLQSLDFRVLDKVVETMIRAETIYICGQYISGEIASTLAKKLRIFFKYVYYINDIHSVIDHGHWIDKNDFVIAISQTGKSEITLNFCEQAKEAGAKIFTLTSTYENQLMNLSDFLMVPTSSYNNFETQYISNEIIIKIILDTLIIYLEKIRENDSMSISEHNLLKWKKNK